MEDTGSTDRTPPQEGDRPGSAAAGPGSFVIATFNVHAGVDGWGRPFDVVGTAQGIDADVLVLEESWSPEGGPGTAERVAAAMGYEVLAHPLAGGRLASPDLRADERWMRSLDWRGASHAIFLDSEVPFGSRVRSSARYRSAQRGHWGIAVLSRLPVNHSRVFELGRLARDRAQRAAVIVSVQVGPFAVTVVGTHMSHITYGAFRHYLRLRRHLRATIGPGPAVLAGDMNLWGPPVTAFFPGWSRALRAKTWPAWRPHSHVDHVLVRGPLRVAEARVLPASGSDHLPVRVRLEIDPLGAADRAGMAAPSRARTCASAERGGAASGSGTHGC